jgi:hypothetical protein
MAATKTAITANFPDPVPTALGTTNTDPTFETLQVVQVQLNANTASIHSNRGDDVNGHLTLTITPADYYALRILNHIPFTPSMNPPSVPAHAAAATATQIAKDNRAHAHQRQEFNHYRDVDKTLRNQLIVAMPMIYIVALCNPVIAFGNKTTLKLLSHLHDIHGGITEAKLDRNTGTIKAQWQPPKAIEVLFLQIEDGVAFALDRDDPKSEQAIM